MDNKIPQTTQRPGIFKMFVLGMLLFFLGTPFFGMTVMTIFLLKELRQGILPAMAVLVCVFLLSDLTSALIAAVGSGLFVTGIRMRWDKHVIIAVASVSVSLISVYRVLLFPESFPFLGENIIFFLDFYRAAGLTEDVIMHGLNLILQIFPALLAIWGTIGVLAALMGIQSYHVRKGKVVFKPTETFHLALTPAWILILSLFVFALQASLPAFAATAALNISLYILLLYSFVGIIVLTHFLRTSPHFALPLVILAIFFLPPLVIITILLGIFDTWFDFRNKIKLRIERKLTQ